MTGMMNPDVRRVLLARSLRAFGDGYVAILLPVHLSLLGFDTLAVGAISAWRVGRDDHQ